ncbi:hypothetical protein quinque_002389 [Culex quinquefasciatus]
MIAIVVMIQGKVPRKIENSRDYTAFRTSQGLYRFKVLPFGLTNAPFTMSRLMDRVIGFDLEPNVFCYLDDIVVASETFEDHTRLLRTVGERLRKAGLTISLDKSRFCRKRVTYLGYLLTDEGNTTPPMKEQKKVAEYPWQFLTMDFVGPLPASGRNRNTCLLVVTDFLANSFWCSLSAKPRRSHSYNSWKMLFFLQFVARWVAASGVIKNRPTIRQSNPER